MESTLMMKATTAQAEAPTLLARGVAAGLAVLPPQYLRP